MAENQDTTANSLCQLPEAYMKPKTSQSPADVPTDHKCMNELNQHPVVQKPDITDEPCIAADPQNQEQINSRSLESPHFGVICKVAIDK